MKTKITLILMVIAVMLGLQSCIEDPKITVISDDFNFKAVNLTVRDGERNTAYSNVITVNCTIRIEKNSGISLESDSINVNELPVMPGDEIEIQFIPSCPEQTEAYFTLPDGICHKATVNTPTFKWTVPNNFIPGMQINGESHYETDDCIYNGTGAITLMESI